MPADFPGTLIVVERTAAYTVRPPLVVDCSVLSAVSFDEVNRDQVAETLRGRDLLAPYLIDHELVSVALTKTRLGLADVARQALADLGDLALTR